MNAFTAAEPTNADAICARILTVRGVQVMASCGLSPRKLQSRRGSLPIRRDMISMREACPQPNLASLSKQIILAVLCTLLMQGCSNESAIACNDSTSGVSSQLPLPFEARLEYPYRMDEKSVDAFRQGLLHIQTNITYDDMVKQLGNPHILCHLYDPRHVIDFHGRYPPIGFSACYIISQKKRYGSVAEEQREAAIFRFNVEHRLMGCDIIGDLSQYGIRRLLDVGVASDTHQSEQCTLPDQ